MKLLRDFFRLRTAGRFSLRGRRAAVSKAITITVPAPLPAASNVVDIQRKSPAKRPLMMRWQEDTSSQASGHLKAVS